MDKSVFPHSLAAYCPGHPGVPRPHHRPHRPHPRPVRRHLMATCSTLVLQFILNLEVFCLIEDGWNHKEVEGGCSTFLNEYLRVVSYGGPALSGGGDGAVGQHMVNLEGGGWWCDRVGPNWTGW